MNRQEAAATFAKDRDFLLRSGVCLPPSVRMYTPDEWKHDYALAMDSLAMDAPGPLVTDPNSAIPAILTTTIDPEVIRVILSPLAFADMLSERKKGTWLDRVTMFPVIEETGEVSSYGDFNNNGRAGVNINWPQFQSYLFQCIIEYGERELETVGLAKVNYVSELQMAAADVLNRFQNLTYAFGIAGLQNYGMMNNPYLSAYITPGTKAGGGTAWFSGNNPNATANEIYNDVVALVNKLVAQMGGAIDIKSPMTLAMSPQSEVALTFTNSFGVSVEDLLKKNYPNLKVKTAPQYGTQSTTNPQGYSTAGNVMQLWADTVQGQKTVYAAFNEKLRAHKIVADLSSWAQKYTSGTWGAIIRSPVAIVGMIGI